MILQVYYAPAANEYYIAGQDASEKSDPDIARILDISLQKYHTILLSHGAYYADISVNCNFKSKTNATEALKDLEPLIIMQLIVGEV